MGFRLKITLKSERKFVVLAGRPVARWCERCRMESRFVDEEAEASAMSQLPAAAANDPHRLNIDGRSYLCLRSIAGEP